LVFSVLVLFAEHRRNDAGGEEWMLRRTAAVATAFALAAFSAAAARAEAPHFTAEQAKKGATAYAQHCAACHGEKAVDGQFGPALKGPAFMGRWGGRSAAGLHDYIKSNMPPTAIGQLDEATYTTLLAFLFEQNGLAAGGAALPAGSEALASLTLPGALKSDQDILRADADDWIAPGAVLPAWPKAANPLEHWTPVTEAMLDNPAPGEWLAWRRGHNGDGYSPLTDINKRNVKKLTPAWSLALPPGANTSEPLVHDGVLFVWSYNDNIQALDAKTGQELWHYGRRLPQGQALRAKRNFALWGDKLFAATSDAHVVALDVKTGRVAWDRPIAAGGPGPTGGPLVADGVVMQGLSGSRPGGGYIVGFDAKTGKELWRTRTVAQPGEPNGDTWNDLPAEKRTGGSIWTSGTFDAGLDLAFFGPSPTYKIAALRDPIEKRGVTNDALYTDSTIAIRPKTGELVWYYQHMKNDQWDMDWAFERVVFDMDVKGKKTRVVATSGKEGIFDILEAATGKYVTSIDMGLQDYLTINRETGEKTRDPSRVPGGGQTETFTICPHGVGGRNWTATSLDPKTDVLYVPAIDICMDMIPPNKGVQGFSMLENVILKLRPGKEAAKTGKYGVLQAIDLKKGKILWDVRQRAPQTTATLTTGGGLLFAAALDRWFTAYDSATGNVLWKTQLNDIPHTAPITYSVAGKQYVAILTGYGAPGVLSLPGLTPENTLPRGGNSSSIFVYALP
jgi:alcohol dehydrogenase (cytochrome c)